MAALTLGASGGAQTLPTSGLAVSLTFGARPALSIEGVSSGGIGSLVGGLATAGSTPAQVVVDMPAGYTVSPPPAGTQVGFAVLVSAAGAGEAESATFVSAPITADDPAHYATDPAAQACAPGTPTAVWKVATTVVGLGYTLPIFVGHPADDAQGVELRFCPPPLAGPDGKPLATPPMPLATVGLLLTPLGEPTSPGTYTSRAFVTASGANGAPDPQTTTEVRFLRPVPHVLSAKGRYDPKTKDAVVTGLVTELAKPQPQAVVEYFTVQSSSSAVIVSGGSQNKVRASAGGTFTIRKRISKTTVFVLDVASTTGACQGPSTAPRGCVSETVGGTGEKEVRVVVPRR